MPTRLTATTALGVLAASTVVALGASSAAAAVEEPSRAVYDDALASGWTDWSWGGVSDLRASGPQGQGQVIRWRASQPWSGLYLHSSAGVLATAGSTVQLSVKPIDAGVRLHVVLFGDDLRAVAQQQPLQASGATLPAGAWTTVRVDMSQLGIRAGQRITGLAVHDVSGVSGKRIEVDDIRLVDSGDAGQASVVTAGGTQPAPAPAPALEPAPVSPPPPAARELRPGNAVPNATRGTPTDPSRFFGYEGFRPYYAKVDGNFTGTTEEILAWAAAKWGMDGLGYPDLAKAIAVHESWWRQEAIGRMGERGIVQVHPGWPGSEASAWSTAFAADYGMAVIRHHYDGASWLGDGTLGNLRNAVAAWECGCGYNGGNRYAELVFASHNTKLWLRPGAPPEWF